LPTPAGIQNAEGIYDFPQVTIPTGADLPWREVSITRSIPDNTVSLNLMVGLEKVTGTLWITDIRITTAP